MIAMMPHPPCPGRCHSCIPAWLQRRLAPLTTISTCRLPQREQTSRSRQSKTGVSAPYRAVLDRWVSGAREAAPRPAPELVQSEPAVAAPLGSLPNQPMAPAPPRRPDRPHRRSATRAGGPV
jgi:hypothetical protein